MTKYSARYFFDPGAGICLWADNDKTRAEFGYPINHDELPLTASTMALLDQVIRWFDLSLNWSSPSEPLPEPWTPQEKKHFDDTAGRLLALLRQELGAEWEISDEARRFSNH